MARNALGMATGCRPWLERGPQGLPRSERARQTADIAFCKARQRLTTDSIETDRWLVDETLVDLGQGPDRATPFCHERWPVITTKSVFYSYGLDMMIPGATHLLAMGWPTERIAACTDFECRELAGEASSVPITTLVAGAFYLNPHAVWWQGV